MEPPVSDQNSCRLARYSPAFKNRAVRRLLPPEASMPEKRSGFGYCVISQNSLILRHGSKPPHPGEPESARQTKAIAA